MKRCILVAFVILIAIIFPITISAEDRMGRIDSLNITSDEKSQLNLQNANAQIVKKYVAGFCFIFPGTENVDELIQSEEILAEQYLIVEDNNIVSYRTLLGDKVRELDDISSLERANDEDFITKMNSGKNLLTKLSATIEVYSCNYFVDTTHLGSCIYYETNIGDLVYYRGEVSADGKEYLFPAKDFVGLITSVYTTRSENSDKDGGNVDINDYMDLSKYDMNSLSFGFEVNNSGMNKINNDTDTIDRDTFLDKKFIVWGAVSVVGIILILTICGISKHIKNVPKREAK